MCAKPTIKPYDAPAGGWGSVRSLARSLTREHVAAAGSLARAVKFARTAAPHLAKIEVEAKTLAEVREAIRAGAEVILLDNMAPDGVEAALALIGGAAIVEVSGGVRFETLRDYALPGVDVISVGALTHSAPAADCSLTVLPGRERKSSPGSRAGRRSRSCAPAIFMRLFSPRLPVHASHSSGAD